MIGPDYAPPPAWRDWIDEHRDRARAWLDGMRGFPELRRQYAESNGYALNLEAPVTVGDKITWRKIHDRNPLFPILADKVRVRGFVGERLGREAAEGLFPRLRLVTDRAEEIDPGALPRNIVIKANHASGWNMILRAGEEVDADWLRAVCRHWLRRSYAPLKQEWAYRAIPRRILVEDLLIRADGALPDDVKFHMYDGVCQRCTVESRGGGRLLSRHYTPDWEPYDLANEGPTQAGTLAADRPLPAMLGAMTAVAEALSRGFDYLRVDFLDLGDRFFMTELTLYPASGNGGRSFERAVELGRPWHNPKWTTERPAKRAPARVAPA